MLVGIISSKKLLVKSVPVRTVNHDVRTGPRASAASRQKHLVAAPSRSPVIHVCYMWQHGSHQYTPVMLAYIPAPWIRHGKCTDLGYSSLLFDKA